MKNNKEYLAHGCYYHIFNRGNNGETIFKKPENYAYFLNLWGKYITPIADTFCYCLLPNHFHFLIRFKENTMETMVQHIESNESKAAQSAFF